MRASRPGTAQVAPRPSTCRLAEQAALVALAGEADRRQADQPQAAATLALLHARGDEALDELQGRLRPLVEVAARQQRPAYRFADQPRAVRQAGGAQQVAQQQVTRIAAGEGFAGGQFDQQGAGARLQQLQGEARRRGLDRRRLGRGLFDRRDRLGFLRRRGARLRQADRDPPAFHGRGGSHARRAGRRLGLRDAGLRRIDRGARTHRHRRLFPGRGLQQLRPRGCGERQRLAGQPTGYLHRAQEGAATLFFDQISGTGN